MKSGPAVFQRAQCLVQCLFKCPADTHGLSDGFHLTRQARVFIWKLFKIPAGNLNHDIVDGRFKTRRRFAGDIVWNFMETVADRKLGGNFCNGKAGGLRGQGRASRDPRVHFNNDHFPGGRIQGKLNVGAAGFNADSGDDYFGGVPHVLVFHVG